MTKRTLTSSASCLTKGSTALRVAALASAAALSLGVHAQQADPIVDYIFEVRLAYGLCGQLARNAIAEAELDSVATNSEPQYDFGEARACGKEHGATVTAKLKAARSAASKNPKVTAEIEELQKFWVAAMTTKLIPGGSDSKASYEFKRRETNKALKAMGSQVISVVCNGDFSCVEKKSEKLSPFDALV